ncbi:hypothetical protein X943_000028 [Babesia divergens]|uniref:DNA-(apurinic or apyrimidinic site) endonuclease n=1 Tax=Babesia divergens TaxID=32595 RepID=A0AAD9G6A2_BABDI|nr:hypothetical protein X943_000028 [Babesia divergens]
MSPSDGWTAVNVKQRRQWDRELAHLLHDSKDTKAVILCGNLNCAPEDIDLSDPEKLKLEKSPAMHESGHSGYPGCRQSDREGLKWIMQAGRLTDAFRFTHPYSGNDQDSGNLQYTSLAYLGDKTRCAVRTNLTVCYHPCMLILSQLVSKYFMKNVVRCDIMGRSTDLVS